MEVDDPGQQPVGDPVPDDDQGAGGECRLDRAGGAPVAQQRRRGDQGAEVEHEPLHVPEGRAGQRRPGERDRTPRRQRGQTGDRQAPPTAPGSGRGTVSAATATSSQATIPAIRRGTAGRVVSK